MDATEAVRAIARAASLIGAIDRLNRLPMILSLPAKEKDRELAEIAAFAMGRTVIWDR